MRVINLLKDELAKIGYSEIEDDYVFSDVFATASPDRTVPLAAFTHSPPSYRNAAVAVVENNEAGPAEVASNYRALGAPLIFVIEGSEVSIWQAHPHTRLTPYIRQIRLDQVESSFPRTKNYGIRNVSIKRNRLAG